MPTNTRRAYWIQWSWNERQLWRCTNTGPGSQVLVLTEKLVLSTLIQINIFLVSLPYPLNLCHGYVYDL